MYVAVGRDVIRVCRSRSKLTLATDVTIIFLRVPPTVLFSPSSSLYYRAVCEKRTDYNYDNLRFCPCTSAGYGDLRVGIAACRCGCVWTRNWTTGDVITRRTSGGGGTRGIFSVWLRRGIIDDRSPWFPIILRLSKAFKGTVNRVRKDFPKEIGGSLTWMWTHSREWQLKYH